MAVCAVIGHPLRAPGERSQDVDPPKVSWRNEVDQCAQPREGFSVRIARFCLSDGIANCADGFVVSNRGASRKMRRRLAEATISIQSASDKTMQPPPTG